MRIAATMYITAAILLLITPNCAKAFEYEVDMPNSGDPSMEMIRIKIDSCETKFKIKKKDFESFSNNPKALKELVKKAIDRANSGCVN